ncbi:CDP-glycerol glycerophosphotransferase family protein [Clostridium sp. C2-6-12]|uniref:CDP-glycerol glycerophosphotransferase family protein n=1 Tax=Clostridium sp. C2-6-12 TaxID=2698832 RepID=UPI001FAC74CB|nr:CDP-glycerol glycerophosphotransferase family protein [Clostridium sp. C2-6-12]
MTNNLNEKAEIGVYCQHAHVLQPENSKFSLILLHDLSQGHLRWPDIWEIEKWNKFDIGILPGKVWTELWQDSSFDISAWPRHGVYELGYPKSDYVVDKDIKRNADKLKEKLNLKYDRTILYAPSWENDNKEDEFIESLRSLEVNLLIKQNAWPKEYQFVIDNIERMRRLHEGKYDNLFYIEPEESIFTALAISDLVVSDESSVMAEALMFGIPSIAIEDWLIPDCVPSRYASAPFDYVYKCKKIDMLKNVTNILFSENKSIDIEKHRSELFSLSGDSCKYILDLIDFYIRGNKNESFVKFKIEPKYKPGKILWD